MAWKPGQTGNPGGRPPREFERVLRAAVEEVCPKKKRRKLQVIAESLVDQAVAGESWAIQMVADRLDGKPAQESTVNFNDSRDLDEWSRAEIVARLDEIRGRRPSSEEASSVDGRHSEPDSVH